MNGLVVGAWLVAALLGGAGLTALLGRGRVRGSSFLTLAPGLGLALVLALFLGLDGPGPLAFQVLVAPAAVAGVGLVGLAAARRPDLPPEGSEVPARPARTGTVAALLLLAAAAWLYPVGSMRLDPGLPFLVEEAPLASQVLTRGDQAVHPLGAPTRSTVARLLGALGGDPLQVAQVLSGSCQVLALLLLFGGLRLGTAHSMAALLGAAATFAGTSQSWLVTSGLEGALAHLLGAAALALLLADPGPAPAALVPLLALAVSLLEPGLAWPLVLLASVAPWLPGSRVPRGQRWALTAPACLGALGVAWLGGAPRPAWEASLWFALLPLVLGVAGWKGLRAPLLLGVGSLLVAVAGGGAGGVQGSALWAGCVFAAAGELLGRGWDHAVVGRWSGAWRDGLRFSLPWRALVSLAVAFLAFQGLEPGETALNRHVLLAGQKQGVSVGQLFTPLTLADWVETRGAAFGLGPEDLELAARLRERPEEAQVVTLGVEREPLLPSAVIATLAGAPLVGWQFSASGPELEPAAELARRRAASQAAPGERLLLRRPVRSGQEPGLIGARFRAAWKGVPVPGATVEFELEPPLIRNQELSYRVLRNGSPWSRLPVGLRAGRPLQFVVPRTPGTYRLVFFGREVVASAAEGPLPSSGGVSGSELGDLGLPEVVSDEPGTLAALRVRAEGVGFRLPSRSLVPFELLLENPTTHPVDLARFEALRLELEGPDAYPEEARGRVQPLVPASGATLLAPGGQVRLRAVLPTPLTEGSFRARPVLEDAEGTPARLDLEIPFRTWRRLPPGGAW